MKNLFANRPLKTRKTVQPEQVIQRTVGFFTGLIRLIHSAEHVGAPGFGVVSLRFAVAVSIGWKLGPRKKSPDLFSKFHLNLNRPFRGAR